MIIRSYEFVTSAVSVSQYPKDNLPEIVLVGRSNVGKSSFINAMLNHNKIARVSQTPGKTRLINFFRVNQAFYFVDIPGYGYAKVSYAEKENFQSLIEKYLLSTQKLKFAVQLLDIRHKPTADDQMMIQFFHQLEVPILYVLTKADKLSNNQRAKAVKVIKENIKLREDEKMILFSSETKENRDLLLDEIETRLELN